MFYGLFLIQLGSAMPHNKWEDDVLLSHVIFLQLSKSVGWPSQKLLPLHMCLGKTENLIKTLYSLLSIGTMI